ncbi:hypothetical protein pb186bvf_004422 [Paramecium bursaria]
MFIYQSCNMCNNIKLFFKLKYHKAINFFMNNQLDSYELLDLIVTEREYLLYHAKQKQSKQRVIIKLDTTQNIDSSTRAEAYILNQLRNINGIIKVQDFGVSKDRFFLAVEPYSKNIYRMLKKGYVLPLQSILILGIKIITILEQVHQNNIIHRNINPDTIYMQPEIQISNFCHAIKIGQTKSYFSGNKIFGSRNQNFQNMPSPQDDLESLGYLLIYLRNGSLPWMNNIDKCDQEIGKMKEDLYTKKSLHKNMPKGFNLYFNLIRDLKYQNLKNLFQQMMGEESDMKIEWINQLDQLNQQSPPRNRQESTNIRQLTTIPEITSTLHSNCHFSKQLLSSKQIISCKIIEDLEGRSTMDVLDPILEDSIEDKLSQLTTLNVKLKGKMVEL